MINWTKAVLPLNSTVKDVIENLNKTSVGIVLVADSDFKFLGMIVDGDIRRGMLNGVELTDHVAEIINRNPITVSPDSTRIDALAMMETLQVSHIPIVDSSRILRGLYSFNEIPIKRTRENQFLIMAGGFGRRMGSLTSRIPKPMLELAGKPIMEHLIVRAKNSGFINFAIAIHYLGDVIENYFGDGSRLGVNIRYLREAEPLGTAGALALLDPTPTLPIVVSNADIVSTVDFGSLLDFHKSHGGQVTLAVREYEWQNPFGVVELLEGRVVGIKEKPTSISTISVGMYVLDPTVLREIDNYEKYDMPQLFERLIRKEMRIVPFPVYESWADIANYEDLNLANSPRPQER